MKSKIRINWKKRIFPFLGAVVVFVLCFTVLYAGDNVGLSDNGDFRRVLLVNNLEYRDDTDAGYLFKEEYKMKIEGDNFYERLGYLWQNNAHAEIYSSPQFILIKISKTFNYIANIINGRNENTYSIAYLAFLYILMLSAAAWGIFTFFSGHKWRVQIAVFLIFIFMFCDAGYILYFNSFYGEPLQYVALMMLIATGLLIYKRPSIPKVVWFFISLYFFAGAKLANIPYSVMVCVLSLAMLILRRDRRFRIGVIISFALAVCAIVQLYTSIPSWMHQDTTYQSVFFGMIKESDTPEADLKAIGVDKKYAVLKDTNAYMREEEYPMNIKTSDFEIDFYNRVSKTRIAWFYVTHPLRLIKKLDIAISNSAYIRPPNVGNSTTEFMALTNRYSLWSNIRTAIKFPFNTIVVFAGFILLTVYLICMDIFYYRRQGQKPRRHIFAIGCFNVLVLGLWINMVLPIIGNGEADIAKHMFLFTNCIDILIAVCILSVFRARVKHIITMSVAVVLVTLCCNYSPSKPAVEFGRYDGEPVKWEVYKELQDGTKLLVTKNPIATRQFDKSDNSWLESDLRVWLNNDFLAEFTEDELSKILVKRNPVIVTSERKIEATHGNHTHYWNFTRDRADDLAKTAYRTYMNDRVYIPTIDMPKDISSRTNYWVMCPYGNNGSMERFVDNNGFVLHSRVTDAKGVRAVIRYSEIGPIEENEINVTRAESGSDDSDAENTASEAETEGVADSDTGE